MSIIEISCPRCEIKMMRRTMVKLNSVKFDEMSAIKNDPSRSRSDLFDFIAQFCPFCRKNKKAK